MLIPAERRWHSPNKLINCQQFQQERHQFWWHLEPEVEKCPYTYFINLFSQIVIGLENQR